MNEIKLYLKKIASKENLSISEAERAMRIIVRGGATPSQISSYITALQLKGICAEEISGSVLAIKPKLTTQLDSQEKIFSVRSTGNLNHNIVNISLTTAIVLRCSGEKVIDFGKESCEKNASSEILKSLGYNLNLSYEESIKLFQKNSFAYFLEKTYLPRMVDISYIRFEIGFKNLFDIISPFLTPTIVTHHILGCYDQNLHLKIAKAAQIMGVKKLWLISNQLGIDKIIPGEVNFITELSSEGKISSFNIDLSDCNFNLDLVKKNIGHNPQTLHQHISGKEGDYLDMIRSNAAAALVFSESAKNYEDGLTIVDSYIKTGKLIQCLKEMVGSSNKL